MLTIECMHCGGGGAVGEPISVESAAQKNCRDMGAVHCYMYSGTPLNGHLRYNGQF